VSRENVPHICDSGCLLTHVTPSDKSNGMQHHATRRDNGPIENGKWRLINGKQYFSASDLAGELGISRQTLWRWRQGGKIPKGYRFRDNSILFTAEEVILIREFATKIEPASVADARQGKLFNGSARRNS
jgi:HTH domain